MSIFDAIVNMTSVGKENKQLKSDCLRHGSSLGGRKMAELRWKDRVRKNK